MPQTYSVAPGVQKVAGPIIAAHHRHLLNNDVKIVFLFVEKPEKDKGKEVLGKAQKVSGLAAFLAGMEAERQFGEEAPAEFFVISIYRSFWVSRSVTDDQRKALVDHELCHLWSEEEMSRQTGEPTGAIKLSLLPHDLTEFNEIAARHGAWQPDIQAFLDAFEEAPNLFTQDAEEVKSQEANSQEAHATVTITRKGKSVTINADDLARHSQTAARS